MNARSSEDLRAPTRTLTRGRHMAVELKGDGRATRMPALVDAAAKPSPALRRQSETTRS